MGIYPIAKKSPIDQMGKKYIWGKLMVFFTIRSIHPNGTNYNKLLLILRKIYGKINGKILWEKFMGKIYGKNQRGKLMGKISEEK